MLEENKQLKLFKTQSQEEVRKLEALEEAGNEIKEAREERLSKVISELEQKDNSVERLSVENLQINQSLLKQQARVESLENSLSTSNEYIESLKNYFVLSKGDLERQQKQIQSFLQIKIQSEI